MTQANPYAPGLARAAPPAPGAAGAAAGGPAAATPGPGASAGTNNDRAPAMPQGMAANQVITGEAVALELAPASTLSRLMSGVLDAIVYLSIGLALLLVGLSLSANPAQETTTVIVAIAVVMVIAPTTVETLTRGLSPGRIAVGLRIVREDGGAIRFRHALIRALTGIGEIWLTLGSLGLITTMIHPRSKRLGDLVAGTYSLRVRESEVATAPLLMPPELASWAQPADIRSLPDSLGLHARTYLSRTGQLHPRVRHAVGRSFAAALEPYVSPPPPWGTNPERFVAAVLVARRDAEYLAGLEVARREYHEAARSRVLPFSIPDAP